MSFNIHINEMCKKIIGTLMFINRIKDNFDKSTRIMVIEALVLSQINYCNIIWGSASKTQLQRVQRLQNFAAKVADGSARKFDLATPIINRLKWMKIKQKCEHDLCCFIFKMLNGGLPEWFISLPTVAQVTQGGTRQANNLFIPRMRTEIGTKAIKVRGPTIWNNLPSHIREFGNFSGFKNALKQYSLGRL